MNDHLHGVPTPVAEDLAAQDAALDVTCPHCHAQRDAYCVGQVTGAPMPARVSHWQRIRAAASTEENPR